MIRKVFLVLFVVLLFATFCGASGCKMCEPPQKVFAATITAHGIENDRYFVNTDMGNFWVIEHAGLFNSMEIDKKYMLTLKGG